MSGNLIVTTPKHQMHALAYQGIMISDCHAQLRDMIRNRLGDAYVLLFAEPVSNTADNSIDWYTPVQGNIRHLHELPAAEQNAMRDKLAHMARELRTFAEELQRSPEHTRLTRGNILDLALRYPDENCLYVVGEQPVFTCWGFGPGTPGAEPRDLSRITKIDTPTTPIEPAPASQKSDPQEPSPKLAPQPKRRSAGLLWWLLPLLLFLLFLCLLFTSFGTLPALSGITLFHAPALPFSAEKNVNLETLRQKNIRLEQTINDLYTRVRTHAEQCKPEKAQVEPPAKPLAEIPAVPPHVQEEQLIIPEEPDNMHFLQGYWRCETGLVNSKTKEPIVVEFRFDAKGKGEGIIFEKNTRCQGEARATLTAEELHIELDRQLCASGSAYSSQDITCRNNNGAAQCSGTNQGGKPWNAHFFRISR